MIFCDSQDEETFWSPNTAPRLAGKADKQEVALCQGPQSHTPGGSSIPVWWLKAEFVNLAAKRHFLIVGVWLERYLTPQDIIKSLGLETN